MIVLDTDVLAVHHIFHNDPRYQATKNLVDSLKNDTRAVTIFNLLEFCGILATAGKKEDAKTVFDSYLTAVDATVLFPRFSAQDEIDFWSTLTSECFSRTQKGLRLGDAAILWTLETNADIESFVTWNTRHFTGKTSIKILTPHDFS
jgi:predicted nucleic acid-binding protein